MIALAKAKKLRLKTSGVEEFCRKRGIRKLSLFGSSVRDDYLSETSDVDVLAEFLPGALRGIGWDYFGYGYELSQILGKKVDFCSRLDPRVRTLIEDELVPLYEQA
jgi:uncharacterized protein